MFAICALDARVHVETKTLKSPPDDRPRKLAVACDRGTRAVGGGVVQAGPPSVTISASGPVDGRGTFESTRKGDVARGWLAFVSNGSLEPRKARVFAVCAADSEATLKARSVSVVDTPGAERLTHCAGGTRVLSGGFLVNRRSRYVAGAATGPLDATATTTETDTGDIARFWYAAAYNNGATPVKMKVLAICE